MTSFVVNCRATIFRFLNVLQVLWLSACCAAVTAAPPVVGQVNQALDIAERSAEHGLTGLSMTAVRRALEFGLPTVAVSQQPVALVHSGARIDTSAALPVPPLEAIRLRVPRTVLRLVKTWQAAKFDVVEKTATTADAESSQSPTANATATSTTEQQRAQQIFETLRHIVLPAERPHEVFLYSLPVEANVLQPARLPSVDSVAQQLITAGSASGQLAALQQQLVDSGAELVAEGRLLQLMCCMQLQDPAGIATHSLALNQMLQAGARRETALLAAAIGQDLLNSGHHIPAASAVLSAAAKTLAAIQQHDGSHHVPVTAVLLLAARGEFAADQPNNATELLQLCLQQNDGDRNQSRRSTGPRSRQQHLVAQQLVARQQLGSASQLLSDAYVQNFAKRWLNTAVSVSATATASTTTVAKQKTGAEDDTNAVPPQTQTSRSEAANSDKPQRIARIIAADQATEAAASEADQWIWVCALDTINHTSKRLFALPDFQHADHLAISADGQRLAFDATFPGEPITSSGAIYTVDLSQLQLQHLGPGVQPSWSPQSRRLVCNRFSPDRGVWILRTDGSQAMLLDGAGWSSLWSPDGSKIAYTRSVGERSEFMIYNVVEDDFSGIATGRKVSPAQSSWNFCWAPDSQQLLVEAFSSAAENAANQAFIRVNAASDRRVPQLQRRSQEWNGDFTFNAAATQLLLALKLSKSGNEQLVQLAPAPAATPVEMQGQAVDRRNISPVWLSDGRTVLYISRPAK